MKVEEIRCREVHLLTFHARKVINCISKPEPQGITSKMVRILLEWWLWGAFFVGHSCLFFVFT